MADVLTIRMQLSLEPLNNYGVPAEYSSLYDKSISEITAIIFSSDCPAVDREKVKFFFGNVATKFDNNASEIVSMVIASYGVTEASMAIKNRISNYFFEFKRDNHCIFTLRS